MDLFSPPPAPASSKPIPPVQPAAHAAGQQTVLFNESASVNQLLPTPVTPAQLPAETIEQLHDLLMAQYDMSLYERRIFLKTVELLPESVVNPDGVSVFEPIYLDAREIIADSGLKGASAFTELQKATKSLIRHVCQIAEQDGLLQTGLLSSAKYLKGKGTIRIHIDPVLHPYLKKIKNKLAGQLPALVGFKSYYSQCLYELFDKAEKPNGQLLISLDRLRQLLRIKDTEYERYFDLKRFVLQQAQKELAATPYAFTFGEKKAGKKVVGILFYFPTQVVHLP